VRVNVSFSSAERRTSADENSSFHPIKVFLRAVGITIANLENAPLLFHAFDATEVFASAAQLRQRVSTYYIMQGMRETYKLFMASDVLGNPVGLLTSLAYGVRSLVVEPARAGWVEGPQALPAGMARGVSGFVLHTLYGLFNTASKVSGSFTKGLSSLVMYEGDGFRSHRNIGVWSGLAQGVDGLWARPSMGWEQAGVSGFMRGGVIGTVGFVVWPMAGVFNTISGGADAVRSALNPYPQRPRLRSPRLFDMAVAVKPYRSFGIRIPSFDHSTN
jgi:vacuolar protein sorting-associated protein 13A/C